MPVPQEIDLAVPEVTLPKGLRYELDNFKKEFSFLGSLRANCLHCAAYKFPGETAAMCCIAMVKLTCSHCQHSLRDLMNFWRRSIKFKAFSGKH